MPGLLIVALISALAFLLARIPALAALGLSALTIAIFIGALLGNLGQRVFASPVAQPGLQLAQKWLLRAGVALYGLNLSPAQILQVGPAAIVADLFVVSSTLLVGWWVGHRWLKMDRDTVLLSSAGSGICGAAAVVATESVLGAARVSFGIYVGSTVHEVAQVVAIGKTIGGATAETAVIVKMIRVMMLAPFLIVLACFESRSSAVTTTAPAVRLPGFAIAFIVIAIVNPYLRLPTWLITLLRTLDLGMLAAAMAALGLDTTIRKLRLAGRDSLVLGGMLFAYLVIVGGMANWFIQRMFTTNGSPLQ